MGVASGCGEQEAGVASGSGWNLWVWLLGVVVRRYIDFLILLIPTPLVYRHPYFLFNFLCFSFFIIIYIYTLVPLVMIYMMYKSVMHNERSLLERISFVEVDI